ncbi:hypothetical protein ACSSS7_004868 [Eimeria intestinalis]
MSLEAVESENLQQESQTEVAGSAPDSRQTSQHEFDGDALSIERNPGEVSGGSGVSLLDSRHDSRRSLVNGEAATNQQPRGAAAKVKRPLAGLLFLLLAVVAASSGFFLAGRKLGGAPVPPALGEGEEPLPPSEAPLPPSEARLPSEGGTVKVQRPPAEKIEEGELKQPAAAPEAVVKEAEGQAEADEAEDVTGMTVDEEEMVTVWFEDMFVRGSPQASFPIFLRGQRQGLEQFRAFVNAYRADLEGGEEKDEEAGRKRRLWTLFKMQMASVASLEVLTLDRLADLPMSGGYENAVKEINGKLKEICRLKVDMAALWRQLAEQGGLHPDAEKEATVLSLLRAQEVHYERAFNRLSGLGPRSTPKASNYKGDPRLEYKRLCTTLGEADSWLMYAMP